MQQLPLHHPCSLPASPWGEAVYTAKSPVQDMLRLQLELSNSHFPFIKLTNKCPAGEQASGIDSATPLGPISLLHFNIY